MLTTAIRRLFQPQRLSPLIHRAALCLASRQHSSKCLDVLTSQQKLIHKSLDALEGWTHSIKQETHSSSDLLQEKENEEMTEDLQHFRTFYTEYVDSIHFNLEEGMFPFIRRYMKHTLITYHDGIYLPGDHTTARQYISQIDNEHLTKDFDQTLTKISEFITLLTMHGQNSVSHLYPQIEETVPETVMQEVDEYCEQFLDECMEKQQEMLMLCDTLYGKYDKGGEFNTNEPSEFYKRMSYFDDL